MRESLIRASRWSADGVKAVLVTIGALRSPADRRVVSVDLKASAVVV